MILRNWRSASSIPAAVQRSPISPDCQRLTLRLVRRTHLDHRLARVGRLQRALQRDRVISRRVTRERLGEPFAQRAGGAGVGAVELAGERCSRSSARSWSVSAHAARSRALDGGPVAFGQVVEHVAFLVTDTSLDRRPPEHRRGSPCAAPWRRRSRTGSPCSGSRPRSTRSVSSAVATVAFSVDAFPEPERDLDALGRDPERDDVGAALQLDPVEHHHRQAHVVEAAAISSPSASRVRSTNVRDDRRLRRRPRAGLDLLADRLLRALDSGASRRRRASARAPAAVSGSRSAKCS